MTTIQFRRGSASQWNLVNPVLASGEPGFELDTGRYKIGDGASRWRDLAYMLDVSVAQDMFSRVTVDGVVQPSYDIDSTPITAGDIGAYTRAEVDELVNDVLRNTGPWAPLLSTATAIDDVSSEWLIRGATGQEYKPEDYLSAFTTAGFDSSV